MLVACTTASVTARYESMYQRYTAGAAALDAPFSVDDDDILARLSAVIGAYR